MTSKLQPAKGTVTIEKVLTREAFGRLLDPPVSSRQVARYLDIASLFLPEFKEFRSVTGGVSKNRRLTDWHLPAIQEIRKLALKMPLSEIEVELANRNRKS